MMSRCKRNFWIDCGYIAAVGVLLFFFINDHLNHMKEEESELTLMDAVMTSNDEIVSNQEKIIANDERIINYLENRSSSTINS